MKKNFRFFIIDPQARTIIEDEVIIDDDNPNSTYQRTLDVTCDRIGCAAVDRVSFSLNATRELDFWCDDEGLLKNPKHFVLLRHINFAPQQLAGKVLVCEGDVTNGETVSTDITLARLKTMVAFLSMPE